MHRTPLGEQRLAINLRPLQVAYFLRDDDEEGLSRAIQLATARWGGLYHLLLPMTPEGSLDDLGRHCLRAAPPDLCVACWPEGDAATPGVNRLLADLFPDRRLDVQPFGTLGSVTPPLSPLDLLTRDTLERHWQPQPAAARMLMRGEYHFPRGHIADPGAPAWLEALRDGALGGEDRQAYARYFSISRPSIALAEQYWAWQDSMAFYRSLINLTGYALTGQTSIGPFPTFRPEIVVVDSVRAACLYWNLRALRDAQVLGRTQFRSMFALSLPALQRPETLAALIAYTRQLALPHWPVTTPMDLTLIVASVSAATAAQAALAGQPQCRVIPRPEYVAHWLPDAATLAAPPRPPAASLRVALVALPEDEEILVGKLPQTVGVGMEEHYARPVDLRLGPNAVPYAPPAAFQNPHLTTVARDLELPLWGRYPRSHAVARLIDPQADFRGFALIQRAAQLPRQGDITFSVPSEWDALASYFAERGVEITESPAGRAGAAVLDLLGGADGIARLSSPLAYQLLQRIALQSTKKVAQRLQSDLRLADEQGDALLGALAGVVAQQELIGAPKTYADLAGLLALGGRDKKTLLALIADLTPAGIILRGYYLPCPACDTREWYPLASVRERLTCVGCGQSFPLPVAAAPGVEQPWHYRLNGLVNRAVDQDVIPHLLALHHWVRLGHQPSCIVTGLEMRREGHNVGEFDLLFVSHGSLYAAECKAGRLLAAKDFEAARLAADLGIATFVFATAQTWAPETERAIAALAIELGPRMQVLRWAASELLPEESLPRGG